MITSNPTQWSDISTALEYNEVHIWWFQLKKHWVKADEAIRLLSKVERDRMSSYAFHDDKINFLISRAILKTILSKYLKSDSRGIQLEYGKFGKPKLAAFQDENSHDISFNSSRTSSRLMITVSRDCEIGVDIEEVVALKHLEGMIALVLSSSEREALELLGPSEKLEAFYRCWTAKEAILKAAGTGLAISPDQVSVSMDPDNPLEIRSLWSANQNTDRWRLHSVTPEKGFVGAIAIEGQAATGDLCTLRMFFDSNLNF